MPEPVQETITLDIKGGFTDEVKGSMKGHEEAWTRISSSVESTANRIEGIARTIGGLAGIVGVSALVNDFVKLENSANQAALAIGNVTGNVSQWRGLATGLLGLQAQYGIDPQAAASSVVNATGLAGGHYSTQQALQLAKFTGLMGQGTGLDPAFLGTLTGQLAQSGNVSATSAAGYLPQVMATLGQTFQGPALGTQAQTTLGLSQMLAARFPFGNTPGLAGQVSGMQEAAVKSNRIYADPSVFGGAVSSLSGGFTNALSNPSAAWLMRVSGVPLMDMISGNPKPQDLAKIRGAMNSMYGGGDKVGSTGWVEQYLTLQAIFGNTGANYIMGVGGKSDKATPAETQAWNQRTGQAAAGTETTSGEILQHLRGRFEQGLYPGYSALRDAATNGGGAGLGVLGWASDPMHLAETVLGYQVAKRVLPVGLRALAGRLGFKIGAKGAVEGTTAGTTAATAAARGASAEATAAAANSVEAVVAAEAAGGAGGGGALGAAGRGILGSLGGIAGGAVTSYLGLMAFPDAISSSHMSDEQIEQLGVHNVVEQAKKRFGKNWQSQQARNWMQKRLYTETNSSVWGAAVEREGGFEPGKYRGAAGQMLDRFLSTAKGDRGILQQLGPEMYGQIKFTQAVSDFEKAVDKFSHGGSSTQTSYHPGMSAPQYVGGAPGNAAGSNTVFVGAGAASMLASSAPGMLLASLQGAGAAPAVPVAAPAPASGSSLVPVSAANPNTPTPSNQGGLIPAFAHHAVRAQDVHIHVNIDGREIQKHRLLTKGRI